MDDDEIEQAREIFSQVPGEIQLPDELVFEFTNADLEGCPCAGTGWLGREWLEKREPRCTCGAGDPLDINLLHDVSCDCIPCPFCPAEETL